MLFAHAFDRPNLLASIRRFRGDPVQVYVVAFLLVAAATALKSAFGGIAAACPFATYTLPMLCMALAGGFWPGIVTLAASLVAGGVLFSPAAATAGPFATFAVFGGVKVILVSGLIASVLRHDEHQQILLGELQHRSGNLFAVVQAIISRTLMESESILEAKEATETRIAALARAHAMIADNNWVGAPLDQIVLQELTSFASQVSCTGCNLSLNTPAAQSFALILHELATNAVKHGALSAPEGRVTITGRIEPARDEALFRFSWVEAGGPAVRPPERKGFGRTILAGMAKRFARSVEATYRPQGLDYELLIPLDSIRAFDADAARERRAMRAERVTA